MKEKGNRWRGGRTALVTRGVMMGESKVKERVWREGKIKWLGEWRKWGISHCGYQATVATW